MSTTAVSASQIMDRAANLLNDPDKTDYNYRVMLPYLNMAIEELSELLEESNNSPSNKTSSIITVPVGTNMITPIDGSGTVHYPDDLTEIQEVLERDAGTDNPFVKLIRREFGSPFPASSSLIYWYWENQAIKFNPNGANTPKDIQLHYISQALPYAVSENTLITMINARSYLSYKTAAFCALFIGENETRAGVLNAEADKAVERITAISNKGRQQIMTRHRPFRASYKMRGWI